MGNGAASAGAPGESPTTAGGPAARSVTAEPAPDKHFFVEGGRRWRRTDPSIPDPLEHQLVAELMAARRAVKAAEDEDGLRRARARVQDAKVALGERGDPWWEPATDAGRRDRIESTTRALLRHRRQDATICPSEVARVIGGKAWRSVTAEVRATVLEMAVRSEVVVRQKGVSIDPTAKPRGPIRVALPARERRSRRS